MRSIADDTGAALQSAQLCPIGLVELAFSSGTVRFWTGIGDFEWNGYLWKGTGTLGRIGAAEETIESRATTLELQLSGIPPEVLAIANAEDWQGREARIYYAVVDTACRLIGEPFQIRRGLMDLMTLSEGNEASILLNIESRDIDLGRAKTRRYTAEDQRGEYPDDMGCDCVAVLQSQDIIWNLQ